MEEVLADRGVQMALAEKDELVEALALDGTDEAWPRSPWNPLNSLANAVT
jgi:hypothetical protein